MITPQIPPRFVDRHEFAPFEEDQGEAQHYEREDRSEGPADDA